MMRKRRRGQRSQSKAKDADGLTPVKDDNAARRPLDRRTVLSIFGNCSNKRENPRMEFSRSSFPAPSDSVFPDKRRPSLWKEGLFLIQQQFPQEMHLTQSALIWGGMLMVIAPLY